MMSPENEHPLPPTPVNKGKEAHKLWHELVKRQKIADQELLTLIAHPEATDEQILEAAHMRRVAVAKMREIQPLLYEFLNKKGLRYAAQSVIDDMGGKLYAPKPKAKSDSPAP